MMSMNGKMRLTTTTRRASGIKTGTKSSRSPPPTGKTLESLPLSSLFFFCPTGVDLNLIARSPVLTLSALLFIQKNKIGPHSTSLGTSLSCNMIYSNLRSASQFTPHLNVLQRYASSAATEETSRRTVVIHTRQS